MTVAVDAWSDHWREPVGHRKETFLICVCAISEVATPKKHHFELLPTAFVKVQIKNRQNAYMMTSIIDKLFTHTLNIMRSWSFALVTLNSLCVHALHSSWHARVTLKRLVSLRMVHSSILCPVLVVGASGKVGRLVVSELVSKGQSVHALVRDRKKAESVLPRSELVTMFECSLDNKEIIRAAMSGCRAVIAVSGTVRFSKFGDFLPW